MACEKVVVLVTGGMGLLGQGMQRAVDKVLKGVGGAAELLGESVTAKDVEAWKGNASFYWASIKDGDLRDPEAARLLFDRVKPTHVVHLAAKVGGLFANMNSNIEFMRDNINLNDNVMLQCHLNKVKRAIFCLSTCVYPAEAPLPLTEEVIHQGPPHPSNEGYAMAKRMVECMCRFYRQTYGYDWVCVIPTNLYGPHDNFNLENAHVLPAMLHKCYNAKSQALTIRGC